MDSSVIVLDSDDEDFEVHEIGTKSGAKRTATNEDTGNENSSSKIRRIQPTKIGSVENKRSSKEDEIVCNHLEIKSSIPAQDVESNKDEPEDCLEEINENGSTDPSTSKEAVSKNEVSRELKELIETCRAAESSAEMKQIIKKKLLKYYHSVHPDYVMSKNFLISLRETTNEIKKEPHLVYIKLKDVIEELDTRRKSKATVVTSEESLEVKGTGDEKKDLYLKKLYKALVKLKRHIADLEEAEVDWDDDEDSSYLKKVRFEKRACEIYNKICEITGESAHAHRIVKKPIKFKGTDFPEFNIKLQKFVNKNKSFPNYFEVLRLLDYCNKTHNFGLSNDQTKSYAQDAFEKLGKTLQKRRKDDFYESAVSYVGKTKDPAKDDPKLRAQLEKNKKFYTKYDEIINEFADKEQKANSDDAEEVSSTSKNEQPGDEDKELRDVATKDLNVLSTVSCDKSESNTTGLSEDDLVIIS